MIEDVIDLRNLLPGLLPSDEEAYGNTIFNRLQIPRFLSELASIASKTQADNERKLLSDIRMLAERCAEDLHKYLKFIGD
jgi:hypothetical protein